MLRFLVGIARTNNSLNVNQVMEYWSMACSKLPAWSTKTLFDLGRLQADDSRIPRTPYRHRSPLPNSQRKLIGHFNKHCPYDEFLHRWRSRVPSRLIAPSLKRTDYLARREPTEHLCLFVFYTWSLSFWNVFISFFFSKSTNIFVHLCH